MLELPPGKKLGGGGKIQRVREGSNRKNIIVRSINVINKAN